MLRSVAYTLRSYTPNQHPPGLLVFRVLVRAYPLMSFCTDRGVSSAMQVLTFPVPGHHASKQWHSCVLSFCKD
eukprot:38468-Rhodomonas_salina.5